MDKVVSHIKNFGAFYFLVAGFIALQYYRIFNLAPPPEYIWDNVYLWDWARNFGNLNFTTFVPDSHHQLRWGNWGFAALLIKLFSDEILYYYLATVIPSSLAVIIFIYIAWRHAGILGALAFITLWYYDALLYRATFQLLPSGAGLLPCALMLLLCVRLVKTQLLSPILLLALSATMFWLYGTKETHLAFLPAVMWLVFHFGGVRALFTLIAIMVVGYAAETYFFYRVDDNFSWLGRIHAVADGGQHVTIMTEHPYFIKEQQQYFDSGITMRWAQTGGVTPVIVFLAVVIAILVQGQQYRKDNSTYSIEQVLAMLVMSFVICTTFFVISVSPIRLGHGLVGRYVTLLLPLAYLLVIRYSATHLKDKPIRFKIAILAIIPFYIAPSIYRFDGYNKMSITEISQRYNNFGAKLKNYDCVRAKRKVVAMNQLDMVPQKYRLPEHHQLITNDQSFHLRHGYFIAKANAGKECKSTYTITRDITNYY